MRGRSLQTAALLWTGCRPHPDIDAVAAAVGDGADVEVAVSVAIAQRVSPLLARAFDAAGVAADPAVRGPLDADAARCTAQVLLVFPRLAGLALTPLHEAGLEPLVMKGAALVDRYPAPGLRPMDDVDIVLPLAQHPAALDVLRSNGWRTIEQPGMEHHEVQLVHPEMPGLPLELHWALGTWRQRANNLTSDELWRQRRPMPIAGAAAGFGLHPELELVSIAAHAGKPFHLFARLLWTVDLLVVVDSARSGGAFDWDEVCALAEQYRCRTALAVGLSQAARLGLDSPARLRHAPVRGARQQALAPLLSAEWPVLERDVGVRNRLRYAIVDSPRRRVALAAAAITEAGPLSAPGRAVELAGRGVRRWWRLRSAAGQRGDGALEP